MRPCVDCFKKSSKYVWTSFLTNCQTNDQGETGCIPSLFFVFFLKTYHFFQIKIPYTFKGRVKVSSFLGRKCSTNKPFLNNILKKMESRKLKNVFRQEKNREIFFWEYLLEFLCYFYQNTLLLFIQEFLQQIPSKTCFFYSVLDIIITAT